MQSLAIMAAKAKLKAVLLLCLLSHPSTGLEKPNSVGRVPALGWNSWNAYGCNINSSSFLTAANALLSTGLKDAGYIYVNIDDCWSMKDGRDDQTHQLIPNATRFPDGIKGVADEVHDLGLRLGIYSSAGTETCGGYPASIGYESIDAATWAAWGVDYLKYDNCNVPTNWSDTCVACTADFVDQYGTNGKTVNGSCLNTTNLCGSDWSGTCHSSTKECPSDYDYSTSYTAERFRIMGDALTAQNRTILYSLCEWGYEEVWTWGNLTANSWRTTNDINPSWQRIAEILNVNSFLSGYAGFTGHNDPDMLEIGNGKLTEQESRSHFALWALMKAPLIIGTDLTALSQTNLDILLNPYLLAFNQDLTFGAPAAPYKWGVNPDWTYNQTNPAEYWSGESVSGVMVAMLNTLSGGRNMTATLGEIPGTNRGVSYTFINAWNGSVMGCNSDGVTMQVDSHDTAVLLLQEGCEGA